MKDQKMFSSEVELSKFLGSTDVIQDAYRAISKTSSTYQLHTTSSGLKVLAFNSLSDYTTLINNSELDLVSPENHNDLHFLSTQVNPECSINKAAVELFEQHFDDLLELLNHELKDSPLVVTGRGLGGHLAILFALRHQHAVDESNGLKTAKRPICITFGAPLLGDETLRRAISERPQWSSCFLNVVANKDTLACVFSSNTLYKPFGTFLFCTASGGHTAFEDQETILAVLDDMASSNGGNSQMHDYTNELGLIRRKILYRGVPSEFGEFNLDPLTAGIMLQFQEIGLLKDDSQYLIAKTKEKRAKMIKTKRMVNAYEPTKKLNEMKISLTYMEWYMKGQRSKGGYYDSFKNAETKTIEEIRSQQEIIRHQRILNQYWKKTVEDNERMPQKQGANLRKRWLYGGTNYRRIVEPLDIANYYKNGKTNYIDNRPDHYVLLERWSEEERKQDQKPNDKKTKAASLTEDSCFWAHVEEALISLRDLKNGELDDIAINLKTTNLKRFEEDVLRAINDFSLSPEVFVPGSSLMKWWSDYKVFKGSAYHSEFAQYMNNKRYTNYQ